uniref:Distal membrane-arm assembly complex protein 2 n=1 Tax=Varanus komodoensis TaxID=61221 RepID=A0A8D2Q4F2_VARKO
MCLLLQIILSLLTGLLFSQMRRSKGFISLLYTSARHNSNSTGLPADSVKNRVFRYLCKHFYDVEYFAQTIHSLKKWNLQRKNRHFLEACQHHGDDLVAVAFVLNLKGGVRCQGQRTCHYGSIKSWQSTLNLTVGQEVLVEAIDLSGTLISYEGLDNLVNLKALKQLDLSRCPNIDDWSLGRFHSFADVLEELSLAGCPQISERGLACLHHLRNLKRLNVSNLPSIPNKPFIRILLEEMLPHCEIIGMESDEGLVQLTDGDDAEELQNSASNRKHAEISA